MNNEQQDGLRILKAEIKNFKNITHTEVDLGGKSIVIAGQNGAGKSSFIQALYSPIDSNYTPLEPIKNGEENAEIELSIGGILNDEMVTYIVKAHFDQGNKKGTISLFDQDGSKIKGGKSVLESIVGNIGFDIFDFIKKGRTSTGKISEAGVREQIEILSDLMPLEGRQKLQSLELEKKTVYQKRAEVNLEVKSLEVKSKTLLSPDDVDKYSKEKDASEVKEKITKLSENIEKWNQVSANNVENDRLLEKLPSEIEKLEELLKEKKEALSTAQDKKPKYEAFFKKNPEKPSIDSLSKELEKINEHNEKFKEIQKVETYKKDFQAKQDESQAMTDRLSAIKEEKKSVFAEYPLPVKGLEFDEESITYKGLPLNGEQIPSSTIISIGVRIGMAMNPNLRLMIIRDGSLLDSKTMNDILKICENKGYQLLVEKVVDGVEDVEITFVESTEW